MKNFERIKIAIQNSTLEESDKKELIDIFAQVSDENLEGIAELFETKPEWLTVFNDNRKKKLQATSTGDENLFTEILEQEKKYIQDLTYNLD